MAAIDDLVLELAKLPGIGRKTAARLTFHLLHQPRERISRLAAALSTVAERVGSCPECGNYCEGERCPICTDPRRDAGLLCLVEEPSTVALGVRSTGYRGRYMVLGGHLAPLDGVGPDQLRIGLVKRKMAGGEIREVILATNPSLEGEATATFVHQLLTGSGVRVSRLARGLPVGGDLEYIDGMTLSHAMDARQEVS